MKLVYVEWEDITTYDGWVDMSRAVPPIQMITVGFLIYKNKKYIHVAPTIGSHDKAGDPWTIPTGVVTKYRVLEQNVFRPKRFRL